jgi:hypothetical protein
MFMETLPVQRENGLIRVSGEFTMHQAETIAPLLLAPLAPAAAKPAHKSRKSRA